MNKLAQVNIGNQFFGSRGGFGGSTNVLQSTEGISKITQSLIGGAISVAGVILLFILIIGGIGIIQGAGNNDPKAVEQGKKAATSALIGFIVVFASYWIVKLIESITGLVLL